MKFFTSTSDYNKEPSELILKRFNSKSRERYRRNDANGEPHYLIPFANNGGDKNLTLPKLAQMFTFESFETPLKTLDLLSQKKFFDRVSDVAQLVPTSRKNFVFL